eukprot:GHVO01027678.1.p1 GENE.GHVO01027678.1~~GHVO01027678.1.p1  ORF type:complete len:328 (+),score=65.23 GHVO01027678.1:20-1003(+)
MFSNNDFPTPIGIHDTLPLTRWPTIDVCAVSNIGSRLSQEDRFTVCPSLIEGIPSSLIGVFDGTGGAFVSEHAKEILIPHLVLSTSWQKLCRCLKEHNGKDGGAPPDTESIRQCCRTMFIRTDRDLLSLCRIHHKPYACSTAVVLLIIKNIICVGHVGDSRAVVGRTSPLGLSGTPLTTDHRPDDPGEMSRIIANGGSVQRLRGHSLPFLRGGDYADRRMTGERPQQLQYSRAFGGKDWKPYGLISDPDLIVMDMDDDVICLILGSDGLWNVIDANEAVRIAVKARDEGASDPAAALVDRALELSPTNADNITAAVVFPRGRGAERK